MGNLIKQKILKNKNSDDVGDCLDRPDTIIGSAKDLCPRKNPFKTSGSFPEWRKPAKSLTRLLFL